MLSGWRRFAPSLVLTWYFKMSRFGRFKTNFTRRAAAHHWVCDVVRGHLECWSSVTVHELSLRENVALVQRHRHVLSVTAFMAQPCFWHKADTKTASAELTRCCTHRCLTSLSMFGSETKAVCLTPCRVTDTPSFFHWQAVCLFVVMSLFLFNHSGCFFVSFYRQHASTNATMVFKANCDVHYFHCCLILFGLCSSTHRLAS